MTELLTRLRFALAALQGRPIARRITAPCGIVANILDDPLVEDITASNPNPLYRGSDTTFTTYNLGEWNGNLEGPRAGD